MKNRDKIEAMLATYPAPWKVHKSRLGDGQLRDGRGRLITEFEAGDKTYHEGLAAAVNLASRTLTKGA